MNNENDDNNEPHLFGDYELIIDKYLDGDQRLKHAVALADQNNRGGLAVLQNAIRNRKGYAAMPSYLADILDTCRVDQESYEARMTDMRKIDKTGGKYRVRVTVEHNRFTKLFT